VLVYTADQRDYLAVVPLAFSEIYKLHPLQKSPLLRPIGTGDITIWPSASSVKAINKILAHHGFTPISDSDFQHATRTTRESLSRKFLITFKMHGMEDRLRFNVDVKFIVLSRLIELFTNLFAPSGKGVGQTRAVNYVFPLKLIRKRISSDSNC